MQVEKSVTTGLEVLGLFTYCQSNAERVQAIEKLKKVMLHLFTPVDAEEEDDAENSDGADVVPESRSFHQQYIMMSVYNDRVG